MAEHSDMLCSKQFWRELWADIRSSWKCVVFGHPMVYTVLKAGGKSFLQMQHCKRPNCGYKWSDK